MLPTRPSPRPVRLRPRRRHHQPRRRPALRLPRATRFPPAQPAGPGRSGRPLAAHVIAPLVGHVVAWCRGGRGAGRPAGDLPARRHMPTRGRRRARRRVLMAAVLTLVVAATTVGAARAAGARPLDIDQPVPQPAPAGGYVTPVDAPIADPFRPPA